MQPLRAILKWIFGASFVIAGANHFIHTDFYVSIMPPYLYLPWHAALVYLSGVAEILLGVMLFFRRMERLAAWGMIALMIAVSPVHIQMALHPAQYPDFSEAALWMRLMLQGGLILLVWWLARAENHHLKVKVTD